MSNVFIVEVTNSRENTIYTGGPDDSQTPPLVTSRRKTSLDLAVHGSREGMSQETRLYALCLNLESSDELRKYSMIMYIA